MGNTYATDRYGRSIVEGIDINNIAQALLLDQDRDLRVEFSFPRVVKWDTDVDWKKGTYGADIEVVGVGAAAVIRPVLMTGTGDINYNTIGDYTFSDASKLDITGGKAQLKILSGSDYTWPFTTPADYTYDAAKIQIVAGIVTLIGISGIYAQYHLNESSGTAMADSSGYGRNGTTVGSPSWVAAKLNNGLQLTGTQYGNLGDIASFERTDPFSVELWIKTTDSSGTLIGRRDAGAPYRGWDIMYSAGVLYFYFANTTVSNMIAVNTTFTIDDNAWHHIVVTYSGSSLASGVKIYCDGANKTITTQYNSLSATTITTSICNLGARSNSNHENGTYDEVIIYNREITATEVTSRYNSGTGTESGGYNTGNPTIVGNTGFVFAANMNQFLETATIPSGTGIKYHVSSDNGSTWKYWTGSAWAVTDDSYTQANVAADINTNIGSLAASGTFKFRALLHSDIGAFTPSLDSIYVKEPITYSTQDNLYIDTKIASQISATLGISWISALFTKSLVSNTDIKVLLSNDNRATWLTWNGSAWVIPADVTLRANAVSITTAETNIALLPIGSNTLDIRLFLYTSDNLVTPTVDNMNAVWSKGFYTSASYVTNIYDSAVLSQNWSDFDVSKIIPAGTSAIIKARASNNNTLMGSYGNPLNDDDAINLVGRYLQFSVDFTGTGIARAEVDFISAKYVTPYLQEVTP
jgi:hypothetical protein